MKGALRPKSSRTDSHHKKTSLSAEDAFVCMDKVRSVNRLNPPSLTGKEPHSNTRHPREIEVQALAHFQILEFTKENKHKIRVRIKREQSRTPLKKYIFIARSLTYIFVSLNRKTIVATSLSLHHPTAIIHDKYPNIQQTASVEMIWQQQFFSKISKIQKKSKDSQYLCSNFTAFKL